QDDVCRPLASDSAAYRAASAARSRRVSRRVADMAPSNARLLARSATLGLLRALPLVRAVGLVGRRLVLGCRAADNRRLLPVAQPGLDQLHLRRRVVASPSDPARDLPAGSPRAG